MTWNEINLCHHQHCSICGEATLQIFCKKGTHEQRCRTCATPVKTVMGDGEILQRKRWKEIPSEWYWVILVHVPDNKVTPFVRWIVGADSKRRLGRYYESKNDALACYDAS